jgi:hypothetical protein
MEDFYFAWNIFYKINNGSKINLHSMLTKMTILYLIVRDKSNFIKTQISLDRSFVIYKIMVFFT